MTLPRPSSPSASVLSRRSGEQSVGMGSPTCQQMGTGGGIRSGFRLLWGPRKLFLRSSPPPFWPPGSLERALVLQEEVLSLLRKGAVEEVSTTSPGFFGRLFCVPKAPGGWMPVLD